MKDFPVLAELVDVIPELFSKFEKVLTCARAADFSLPEKEVEIRFTYPSLRVANNVFAKNCTRKNLLQASCKINNELHRLRIPAENLDFLKTPYTIFYDTSCETRKGIVKTLVQLERGNGFSVKFSRERFKIIEPSPGQKMNFSFVTVLSLNTEHFLVEVKFFNVCSYNKIALREVLINNSNRFDLSIEIELKHEAYDLPLPTLLLSLYKVVANLYGKKTPADLSVFATGPRSGVSGGNLGATGGNLGATGDAFGAEPSGFGKELSGGNKDVTCGNLGATGVNLGATNFVWESSGSKRDLSGSWQEGTGFSTSLDGNRREGTGGDTDTTCDNLPTDVSGGNLGEIRSWRDALGGRQEPVCDIQGLNLKDLLRHPSYNPIYLRDTSLLPEIKTYQIGFSSLKQFSPRSVFLTPKIDGESVSFIVHKGFCFFHLAPLVHRFAVNIKDSFCGYGEFVAASLSLYPYYILTDTEMDKDRLAQFNFLDSLQRTAFSPGMIHIRSKPRWLFDSHQELLLCIAEQEAKKVSDDSCGPGPVAGGTQQGFSPGHVSQATPRTQQGFPVEIFSPATQRSQPGQEGDFPSPATQRGQQGFAGEIFLSATQRSQQGFSAGHVSQATPQPGQERHIISPATPRTQPGLETCDFPEDGYILIRKTVTDFPVIDYKLKLSNTVDVMVCLGWYGKHDNGVYLKCFGDLDDKYLPAKNLSFSPNLQLITYNNTRANAMKTRNRNLQLYPLAFVAEIDVQTKDIFPRLNKTEKFLRNNKYRGNPDTTIEKIKAIAKEKIDVAFFLDLTPDLADAYIKSCLVNTGYDEAVNNEFDILNKERRFFGERRVYKKKADVNVICRNVKTTIMSAASTISTGVTTRPKVLSIYCGYGGTGSLWFMINSEYVVGFDREQSILDEAVNSNNKFTKDRSGYKLFTLVLVLEDPKAVEKLTRFLKEKNLPLRFDHIECHMALQFSFSSKKKEKTMEFVDAFSKAGTSFGITTNNKDYLYPFLDSQDNKSVFYTFENMTYRYRLLDSGNMGVLITPTMDEETEEHLVDPQELVESLEKIGFSTVSMKSMDNYLCPSSFFRFLVPVLTKTRDTTNIHDKQRSNSGAKHCSSVADVKLDKSVISLLRGYLVLYAVKR